MVPNFRWFDLMIFLCEDGAKATHIRQKLWFEFWILSFPGPVIFGVMPFHAALGTTQGQHSPTPCTHNHCAPVQPFSLPPQLFALEDSAQL